MRACESALKGVAQYVNKIYQGRNTSRENKDFIKAMYAEVSNTVNLFTLRFFLV